MRSARPGKGTMTMTDDRIKALVELGFAGGDKSKSGPRRSRNGSRN